MSRASVLVVGAGPAGLAAAKILSRLGVKVTLIEHVVHNKVKPCGGGLTRRCQLLLDLVYPGYREHVQQQVNEVLLVHRVRTYRIRGENIFLTVRREDLDRGFLKHVVGEEGVELVRDKVVKIFVKKDHVEVLCSSGQVLEADILIGADGVYSVTRRCLGIDTGRLPYAVRAYAESRLREDLAILDFRLSWGIGYLWVFPLRGEVNIGYGEFKPAGRYTQLRITLQRGAEMYGVERLRDIRGHALPNRVYLLDLAKQKHICNRVLLVGDAAGLVDYATGEGITFAILSGILAAVAVKSCLDSPGASYLKLVEPVINDLKLSRKIVAKIPYMVDRLLDLAVRNILTQEKPVIRVLSGISTYYETLLRALRMRPVIEILKTSLKARELE